MSTVTQSSKTGNRNGNRRPLATKRRTTRPTGDDIRRYLSLEATRLALQREATEIGKQSSELYDRIAAWIEREFQSSRARGRQVLKRLGFRFVRNMVPNSVAWKQELVKRLGIEEAERIKAKAGKHVVYEIDQPPK